MGSFNQHLTCSTITGICFGAVAYQFGFSAPVCLLSAGLCSMAGMLPDIDSDSSRSFQECIYFAAGLCAVLLVDRLRHFDVERDTILLAGAAVFMFVRFGVGSMIKHITVHRGLFHSIPAAVLAGQAVYFLSSGTLAEHLCKGFALFAGYMSHLILDEICSIDSTGQSLRLKKSFGTALKFYAPKSLGASLALYAVVVALTSVAVKNPNSLDTGEYLEAKIRTALAESSLQQEDAALLISFLKKNILQKNNTASPTTEAAVNTAAIPVVPVVKAPATVQEHMQNETAAVAVSGSRISGFQTGNQMPMGIDNLGQPSGISERAVLLPLHDLSPLETPATAAPVQAAVLPFDVPQHTAALPFEVPAVDGFPAAVDSAPQLPFALPF
ncbi:MAG: metal-dependent hydrolase [Planctomycetaceae bacterium]|nr:metal-dependent hydrolase [Planctomycetaceae bacterium]